jgi:hypothetical protein
MLASEYGWDIGTILALPCDQVQELTHAILYRRGIKTLRLGSAPTGESLAEKMQRIIDTLQGGETEWQRKD